MTAVNIRKYKVFKEQKKSFSPHGAGMDPIQKAQNPAGTAANQSCYTAEKNLCFAQNQTGLFGVTSFTFGFSGFNPIIRYRNCSSVRSAASSLVLGHDREPASSLL